MKVSEDVLVAFINVTPCSLSAEAETDIEYCQYYKISKLTFGSLGGEPPNVKMSPLKK